MRGSRGRWRGSCEGISEESSSRFFEERWTRRTACSSLAPVLSSPMQPRYLSTPCLERYCTAGGSFDFVTLKSERGPQPANRGWYSVGKGRPTYHASPSITAAYSALYKGSSDIEGKKYSTFAGEGGHGLFLLFRTSPFGSPCLLSQRDIFRRRADSERSRLMLLSTNESRSGFFAAVVSTLLRPPSTDPPALPLSEAVTLTPDNAAPLPASRRFPPRAQFLHFSRAQLLIYPGAAPFRSLLVRQCCCYRHRLGNSISLHGLGRWRNHSGGWRATLWRRCCDAGIVDQPRWLWPDSHCLDTHSLHLHLPRLW